MPSEAEPLKHRIGFRPVTADDFALLDTWLKRPHVREWWGDPETELGYIVDMVEGRDTTRPFIIRLDDVDIGYIQYWFLGHHQNETWTKDNPWLMDFPPETVGVDLSIGEEAHLSRGIGSAAVAAFVEMIRQEGHENIIIDPDPANLRAVRSYEKAGFRAVERLKGRTGDTLIMQYDMSLVE